MKAYTYISRGYKSFRSFMDKYNPDCLKVALDLLEPIKLQPEGINQYILVSQLLGLYHTNVFQQVTAIEYLKKAEQAYEEFKAKVTDVREAMNEFKMFGVTNAKNLQLDKSLPKLHHTTMIYLYYHYNIYKNEKMKHKYAMPSIKGKLLTGYIQQELQHSHLVPQIHDETDYLIKSHQFAQVNHLLSVLMCKLVKYRRSLPQEKQQDCKRSQGFISEQYALWSFEIVQYSLQSLKDKNYSAKHLINNEVYRFEELIEPGIEIYENQFPCEPILTRKEFGKSMKRGKAWCNRAIDLLKGDFEQSKAKELMKKLIALEPIIEELVDLE